MEVGPAPMPPSFVEALVVSSVPFLEPAAIFVVFPHSPSIVGMLLGPCIIGCVTYLPFLSRIMDIWPWPTVPVIAYSSREQIVQ